MIIFDLNQTSEPDFYFSVSVKWTTTVFENLGQKVGECKVSIAAFLKCHYKWLCVVLFSVMEVTCFFSGLV